MRERAHPPAVGGAALPGSARRGCAGWGGVGWGGAADRRGRGGGARQQPLLVGSPCIPDDRDAAHRVFVPQHKATRIAGRGAQDPSPDPKEDGQGGVAWAETGVAWVPATPASPSGRGRRSAPALLPRGSGAPAGCASSQASGIPGAGSMRAGAPPGPQGRSGRGRQGPAATLRSGLGPAGPGAGWSQRARRSSRSIRSSAASSGRRIGENEDKDDFGMRNEGPGPRRGASARAHTAYFVDTSLLAPVPSPAAWRGS